MQILVVGCAGDYVEGSYTENSLSAFEAIVFAAGHDIRHSPQALDFGIHILHVNGEAVPRFTRLARDAGVRRFIHIGGYYPHVTPERINTSTYVRSRRLATDGTFALAGEEVLYALGKIDIPPFGPSGGSNFISTQSLSEATAGALEQGETLKAYLLGDENISFTSYFESFFHAVGNHISVFSLDREHPLLPDSAIYTDRASVVSYEPNPDDVAQLGYRRQDIARAAKELVGLLEPEIGGCQ
ncbi:hypothetical protein BDV29DRAFT_159364 [Aspergillus leporis]|uniref:Uncharacterized protein n=1 Tax=Aspergillus leporis TaxID=41062 RepID=A0A5N5WTB9_9EURO|nr:hypothetical protein BDV29DRAFT_159364 [Aspergillus leporis]